MMKVIRQFVKEEEGLAAAEYAILLTLIAVALVTAVTTFRGSHCDRVWDATTAQSNRSER